MSETRNLTRGKISYKKRVFRFENQSKRELEMWTICGKKGPQKAKIRKLGKNKKT